MGKWNGQVTSHDGIVRKPITWVPRHHCIRFFTSSAMLSPVVGHPAHVARRMPTVRRRHRSVTWQNEKNFRFRAKAAHLGEGCLSIWNPSTYMRYILWFQLQEKVSKPLRNGALNNDGKTIRDRARYLYKILRRTTNGWNHEKWGGWKRYVFFSHIQGGWWSISHQ